MSEQSDSSELAPLGDAARQLLGGNVSADAHRRGRERALSAFAKELGSPRRRRVQRAWLSLAAAAVLAAVLAFFLWPKHTLTFDFDGHAITRTDSGGAHIAASNSASLVRFSDGSTLQFAAGASGRIDDVGVHGARVVLAAGSVHVDITHREGTTWTLEAGPYVVHVTGTEFSVVWDPAVGKFEVEMVSGSVRVEAPNTPKGVNVDAGYVLSVQGDGPLTIQRAGSEQAAPTAKTEPLPAPSATAIDIAAIPSVISSAHPEVSSPEVSARPSSGQPVAQAPGSSWPELVSAGKYGEVVRAARARGIDSVAGHAALSDLAALSDAARYERDGEIARAVLEAQRKRFGDTPAGKAATFLLGRLAEDSEKNLGKAIALYDEYLSKGGPYAQEALGRKMVAVRKSRGDEAAKPIATAYLSSYPKGAYASLAQSIVDAQKPAVEVP